MPQKKMIIGIVLLLIGLALNKGHLSSYYKLLGLALMFASFWLLVNHKER